MAPAASLNCNQDMLWETFTYINSSLQHQSLNRGVWKKLEMRERELATKNEVKVFRPKLLSNRLRIKKNLK